MSEPHPNLVVVDHPLARHALTVLRDRRADAALFRQAARRLGLILTMEATRDLPMGEIAIETPLEPMDAPCLVGPAPCVVSIMRAGNGIQQAMLELLPQAVAGHIGLARDEATLTPHEYYRKLPDDLPLRRVILADPMLATGGSADYALRVLRESGADDLRFVCLLAAPEGLRRLATAHPDVRVLTVAIDRGLDGNGYIRPGLGDAGDRFHGT
jgi:uracil phosphoribosyltransferase